MKSQRKFKTIMVYTPSPELQALAEEANAKIRAASNRFNEELESIYCEYRTKADAIRGTSDSLSRSADSQSQSQKYTRS